MPSPLNRKKFANLLLGLCLSLPAGALGQNGNSGPLNSKVGCEPKSLPTDFFEDFKKEQKNSWTENVQILRQQELTQASLVSIIEKILAFQNSQWSTCSSYSPGQTREPGPHRIFHDSRLSSVDTLKMTIAVGYYDQRPLLEVRDNLIIPLFVNQLTSQCQDEFSMNCGFEVQSSGFNDVYLQKRIWEDQTLQVHIVNPSLSTNDNVNRVNRDQQIFSQDTQKKYLDSFADSQFVFYLGHSRNGGGPDFFPPILNASEHTNYKEYRQKRTQINEVIQTLEKIPLQNRPLVFGMSSCSSRSHFQKRLKTVLPSSVLMLTKETVYEVENFESVLVFLNGLQLRKSIDEMNQDLQSVNIAHRKRNNQEMSTVGFYE